MRKLLTITLIGSLTLAALPVAALAGDHQASPHVWAGFGLGIAAATLGGLLLGAVPAPVVAPPLAIYAPPPVVYAPPPTVVYSAPPVVVYRGWAPPGHWKHHRYAGHEYR